MKQEGEASMNAEGLIVELALHYGAHNRSVVVCKHGGEPGYVHVVPAGFDHRDFRQRHVIVELHNGTVAVTARLKDALGAHARPNEGIQRHELGYSAGPKYGRFAWALSFDEVRRWRGGVRGFVVHIAEHLDSALGDGGVDIGAYDTD